MGEYLVFWDSSVIKRKEYLAVLETVKKSINIRHTIFVFHFDEEEIGRILKDKRLFPEVGVEKEKDLVIIDNHDEKMLYWYYGGSLYHLENNLKRLNSLKNTLWYLPAIMGYLKRPSANYWYNKKWEKSKEIKEIYLKVLFYDKKGMV